MTNFVDLLPNVPSWVGLLEPGSPGVENNPWEGRLVPGNEQIDNRPGLPRPNGDTSTMSTITIGIDGGKTALIPTVIDGIQLSPEEAIQHFKDTKQHFGIFDSQDNANKYDEQMHKEHGLIGQNNIWRGKDE